MKENKQDTLLVCWTLPKEIAVSDYRVLSFLRPRDEYILGTDPKLGLFSARQIAPSVKDGARRIYIELVSKIGNTRIGERQDKTLRESLLNKRNISLWWFHKFTEKDCESDPTFNLIVEILIILSVSRSTGCRRIILYGGLKEIAYILSELCSIKLVHGKKKYGFTYVYVRGVLHRAYGLATTANRWLAVKRHARNSGNVSFDAVLLGFWNWSVKEDNKRVLDDIYFKSLPGSLSSKGLETAWFLWFDLWKSMKHGKHGLKDLLEPINRYSNLVILQNFIKLSELIAAMFNFRAYLIFRSFSKSDEFKKTFLVDGINFLPLAKPQLAYGFINSTIPRLELVYLSVKRALERYKPKVLLTFQELFIHSRAIYKASADSNVHTTSCAVQHASYSREKTFALLDPVSEYDGKPDYCPVFVPDYIFAMGELGREIFLESGFKNDRVLLTGSPRYDHIRTEDMLRVKKVDGTMTILLVTSLDVNIEMDMVEAVVCATEDVGRIKLLLRHHPFADIRLHPCYSVYNNRVSIMGGTLEDALKLADLIIFSYSTVAEEALIRGIPVWQWCSASYNGSVFRDIAVIPSFNSVPELKESIKKYLDNPASFVPNGEIKRLVTKECFYMADGKASERIADRVHAIIHRTNQ